MSALTHDWTPASWRARPALQQPEYGGRAGSDDVLAEIAAAGPVVTSAECAALRAQCAAAASGEAFILQAGDCAESLAAEPSAAAAAMEAVIARLSDGVALPVVRIGRIGGQFAKPRSSPIELRGGLALPAYRGDAVNGLAFDASARRADPRRLSDAYRHSVATLAWVRSQGGGLYASHEALMLPYEEALCFRDGGGRWWAGSGHMLWIGERTRHADGAHVAFAAGIANVVGVKCGPAMTPDEMLRLAAVLDPLHVPGRLLLIGRFGCDAIERVLPPLLRAARREGLAAAWLIDPMHGNTRRAGGRKQRWLADIVAEARAFAGICRSEGIVPAGIHLEITAGADAECISEDGVDPMADFPCDPRLSEAQARLVVAASQC